MNNNNNNKYKSFISSVTDLIFTKCLMEGFWDKKRTKPQQNHRHQQHQQQLLVQNNCGSIKKILITKKKHFGTKRIGPTNIFGVK